MSVNVAQWLVMLFQLYLVIGVVFAIAFIVRGAGAIDPVAREGTRGFKVLIAPGCVALWPFLLKRWMSGQATPPDETNPHRQAVKAQGGDR